MATNDRGRAEALISIYFGLERGRSANLEVVAEASIAWVSAIREMALIVDPSLDVTVEIVDGDQGSLWLNTLTAIESKLERIEAGGLKWPRLWALAKGLAFIVIATPLQIGAEDVFRAVASDNPEVVARLSPEDRRELIQDFKKALREDVARPQKQQFFKSAEKDTSIKAIGVSELRRHPPALLVRREEFVRYATLGTVEEAVDNVRKRTEMWDVTLISPVLENAERSWRFLRPGMPELGAVMRDKAFLRAIEHGGLHVELRKGIQMEIEIQFRERLEEGVWMTLERSVLKVIRPTYDRGEFEFGPPAT